MPLNAGASPLRAGPTLAADAAHELRRTLELRHHKWDVQIGDVTALAPFPLMIRRRDWDELAWLAEALANETAALEAALWARPELQARVGVPRSLRRLWARAPLTPAAARVLRFDFHFTTDGWRVSEVNSDVPGGFTEATSLTRAMAAHVAGARPTGDPTAALVDALVRRVSAGDAVALTNAPGHMEDHQVVAHLAARLRERGVAAHVVSLAQLRWRAGHAVLDAAAATGTIAAGAAATGAVAAGAAASGAVAAGAAATGAVAAGAAATGAVAASAAATGGIGAIVRFYQAEWLAARPRGSGWEPLFAGGRTPVTNPGSATLGESKRLPLVWDALGIAVPTWRRLLPETRALHDAPWSRDDGWLIKSAYCNTGDTVLMRAAMTAGAWRSCVWRARLRPSQWIAQRRFDVVPVMHDDRPWQPCVGVYVIDGKAAGAYVRLTSGLVVDFRARDAALLLYDES